MSNDIRDIVEKLAILEGRITPTSVKHGLNPEQKSAKQLPALFKPKHISVLGSKTDPEHPMHGYAVGSNESEEKEQAIEEAYATEEKLLDKVAKSLKDYLSSIEDKYRDDSISKKAADHDLGEKAKDRELVAKLKEDPTQEISGTASMPAPEINPTYESYTMEDGRVCEIHGDDSCGFEIRHGDRVLPTKFKNAEQAKMALEMFMARCRKNDQSADYVDEA